MSSETTGNDLEISPYVLPFVVAVTGHRDLHADDLESVKSQIQDVIETILTALPHTPIHFLSPLADGADQLFAEQVLLKKQQVIREKPQDTDRIKLIVPLPMTIDAYRLEQTSEAIAFGLDTPVLSLSQSTFTSRFNSLASQAASVFTIPHATPKKSSGASQTEDSQNADEESTPYKQLARYLNTHVHLLVAIWDGQIDPSLEKVRRVGGTLDVLLTRLEGFNRVLDSRSARRLAEQESGPVVHIKARRAARAGQTGLSPEPMPTDRFTLLKLDRSKTTGSVVAPVLGPDKKRGIGIYRPTVADWIRRPVEASCLLRDRYEWLRVLKRTESTLRRQIAPDELAVVHCIWEAGIEVDSFNRQHQNALSGMLSIPDVVYCNLIKTSTDSFVATLQPDLEHSSGRTENRPEPPPIPHKDDALASLLRVYSVAGALAKAAKNKWSLRWLLIAIGAVVAGASSSFKVLYPPQGELIEASAFVGGAGLALFTYLWVTLSSQRNAYLEYRALAEGLRFQMYWMVAGNQALVTDHYVQKFRSELGWVRRALDGATVLPQIQNVSAMVVAHGWIKDQLRYLDVDDAEKGRENRLRKQKNTGATNLGNNLLLLGLVFATIVICLALTVGTAATVAISILIVSMKLVSTVGAALLSYNSKMAHSETLRQHQHLVGVYKRARALLDQISTSDQTVELKEAQSQDLLIALGKEALAENANWLSNYLQRKVTWAGR